MIARLRAALTTPAILLLVALVLLGVFVGRSGDAARPTELEARAAQVLSQIQGVGKVSVVISTENIAGQSGAFSIKGQENSRMKPSGAVAVAQGAEDPFVCAQLTQALCALLGLPASSVSVIAGRNMH